MMVELDKDTKEIICSFISEGYERLDDAESRMEFLESDDYVETVNTIFRLFHSIKGSAGFLNFESIKNVTHEAETLLDIFRKANIKPSSPDIDLLYKTLDILKNLIRNVENTCSDKGLEEETALIIKYISESIHALKEPEIKRDSIETTGKIDNLVTDEMIEKFISESVDLLDKSEEEILEFEKKPVNKDGLGEIFRNIHTVKGNSGFFSFAEIEKASMELENILDHIRNENNPVTSNMITNILKGIDDIRTGLRNIKTNDNQEKTDEKKNIVEYKPLGEILVEMGETTEEAVNRALEDQTRPIGEILVEKGEVKEDIVKKALEIQQGMNRENGTANNEIKRKEIRVDMSKLDKLFDIVGELVTAEAIVVNNPELEGLKLNDFNKSANTLNKICRELQELTMMIRMIPLEGLFTKMNRLIRDLSRKFDKRINFHISGEDTEMDRNVIEQISDPLLHIIRNSIDHGIEDRETRLKSNKEEIGNIFLNAWYEGNEIWISVRDDGYGLNRAKIIKKAQEKGMISDDPERYSDQEIFQLIFEPGFSTAEKVSEVSGRGVGMDIVHKNIEKLRGKVDIISGHGKGTEIILKIPLTMAIMDGVTVKVGNNLYSIPTSDIVEFIKARENYITRTNAGVILNLRGEILPVVQLRELFNIRSEITGITEGIIIVLHNNGKKACLLIDSIIGSQQIVIKSISDYLGSIDGISGCSILGDGNVSFIIDTERLLQRMLEN